MVDNKKEEGMPSNKKMFFMIACLVIILLPSFATATTLTSYDANLGGPGYYNGTGGSDGAWTIVTADYGEGRTFQGALRASNRYVGPVTPTVENVYNPPIGSQVNIDYSAYVVGFDLSMFTYQITLNNLSKGLSVTFDPSSSALGNSYWKVGTGKTMTPDLTHEVGFQNSEYFGFSFIKTPINYVAGDHILATFVALPKDGSLADPTVSIEINTSATPEPGTLATLGFSTCLIGISSIIKKKRKKRALVQKA